MLRRHPVITAALVAAAVPLILFTTQGSATASTNAVNYALPSVTAAPNAPCDVGPCQVLSYSFAGSGSTTTAGAPASAAFTLGFTPSKYKSGSSCAFATGTGSLSIIWQDNTTTDVTFTFKVHDAHSWDIKGQVTAGGTNTAFPPAPITPVSGLVGYPPNPCDGATVSTSITFYPPSPV